MSKEEMLKLLTTFSIKKKLPQDWKQKLVEDSAWAIDHQQPSPVKKMFDPKELPFKNESKKSEFSPDAKSKAAENRRNSNIKRKV